MRRTEVAFVERDLGLRTKRFETLNPRDRFCLSDQIVWTNQALPWPITQGIGEVESGLSYRHDERGRGLVR